MALVSEAPPSQARVLSLIGVGHFLSHFYILCLPPMLPLFAREFDVGFALLGGALTGYAWIGGILQAPAGAALEKIDARKMLAAGLALNATAIGLIGLAESFWQFAALAVIAGVGNAVFHPVDYAIIAAKVTEKHLGRAYSLHTFSGFFGGGVAPVAMLTLSGIFDWRTAFILVGIFGVCAAGVILAQGDALAGEEKANTKQKEKLGASKSVLYSAPVLLYFLFLATYGLATGGISSQGVVVMVKLGLANEVGAAQVLSTYQFSVAGGILLGGVIAEKFGRHGLTAAICLLTTAALMLTPSGLRLDGAWLYLVFAAAGFGFGAVLPARDLMVRAITPAGQNGRIFGFVFVGLSIGSGLAGILFGALVDAGFDMWVFPIVSILLTSAVIITSLAQLAARKSQPLEQRN